MISIEDFFHAYNVGSNDSFCPKFKIRKIKEVRKTGKRFSPRNGWEVEFKSNYK